MSRASKAASDKRMVALTWSAYAVQRACRAILARCKVRRRRRAIITLQAFFRACRERWNLVNALERKVQALTLCKHRDKVMQSFGHMGAVTRRDVPMEAVYPSGYGEANLSAFLWENEAAFDYRCAVSALPDGDSMAAANDGCQGDELPRNSAVFELSAAALLRHGVDDSYVNHRWHSCCTETKRRINEEPKEFPLPTSSAWLPMLWPRPRWLPPAVAPDAVLAQALRCPTLVISSPSFGATCARRLFSRIGLLARTQTNADMGERDDTTIRMKRAVQSLAKGGGRDLELGPASGSTSTIACTRAAESRSSLVRTEDQEGPRREGSELQHIFIHGGSPLEDGGISEISFNMRMGLLSRLTTLVIGGPGCQVGAPGVKALARAFSSSGSRSLRSLSLSYFCLGRHNERLPPASSIAMARIAEATHAAWESFFRHLQRLQALSSLSLERCGLDDRDMGSVSIAIQILPRDKLVCLRLSYNSFSASGLRTLLRALTSRKVVLPSLWLRRQQPLMPEHETRTIVARAFEKGLFAEVNRHDSSMLISRDNIPV